MTQRSFDMGDAEPTDITMLNDHEDPSDESSNAWGKTYTAGEWKGYKNGGKVYLQWDELTRRYGPLTPPHLTIGGSDV